MRLWIRTFAFSVLALLVAPFPAGAQEVVRVGHFPNITHVQALVARNFERQGRTWFGERLGPGVKVEWYAYNAGPSAMEAIFANAIDLTYVGPSPALNAYARSRGEEVRIVAGAVNGGAGACGPARFGPRQGLPTSRASASPRRNSATRRMSPPAPGWSPAACASPRPAATRRWCRPPIPTSLPCSGASSSMRSGRSSPGSSRLELEAGGRVLVEEKDAITTVLVSSAKFLAQKRDLARRFVAAHRELTEWIRQNPDEAAAHGRRGVEGRVPGRAAAGARRARLGAHGDHDRYVAARRSRPT